jgi:hypothetical protein
MQAASWVCGVELGGSQVFWFSLPPANPLKLSPPTVALNYQSEGRGMQLNRAKFKTNGNCGYVLKPQQMCKGEHQLHSPALECTGTPSTFLFSSPFSNYMYIWEQHSKHVYHAMSRSGQLHVCHMRYVSFLYVRNIPTALYCLRGNVYLVVVNRGHDMVLVLDIRKAE